MLQWSDRSNLQETPRLERKNLCHTVLYSGIMLQPSNQNLQRSQVDKMEACCMPGKRKCQVWSSCIAWELSVEALVKECTQPANLTHEDQHNSTSKQTYAADLSWPSIFWFFIPHETNRCPQTTLELAWAKSTPTSIFFLAGICCKTLMIRPGFAAVASPSMKTNGSWIW